MSAETELPSLRRQASWVVVWRIISILATLAVNVLAARLLGPARFGEFLLITTVIALGSVLAMGGMNDVGLRFISESMGLGQPALARSYLRKVLIVALRTSLAAALLVAVGLSIYQLVQERFYSPLMVIGVTAAGVFALAWQQIAAESLRGYGDVRLASLFSGGQNGGPLTNLLFLAGLVCVALSLQPVTTSTALTLLVGSIWLTTPLALLGLGVISRGHQATCECELSVDQKRQLMRAAGSLLAIQLLTFATYQSDIWLGGTFLSEYELGLYGAAKRYQLLGQIPLQMAMMAVISIIPRMSAQNRMVELESVIRRATTLAAIPALGALALLAIFPTFAMRIVLGSDYTGAAVILLPLIAGQAVNIITGNPAYILNMTDHHSRVLRVNLVGTVILLAVGSLGARFWGPSGLAVGAALSLAIQNIALWWIARRNLGIWTHIHFLFWKSFRRDPLPKAVPLPAQSVAPVGVARG